MSENFLNRLDLYLEDVLRAEGLTDRDAAFLLKAIRNGKKLRARLFLGFAGGAGEQEMMAAASIELFHYATLVHDDIIDNASMRRRGRPGPDGADTVSRVLLGDLLFSTGFSVLAGLEDERIWKEVNAALSGVIKGELLQQERKWDLGLTEEEYMGMIRLKTGSLFGGACKVASIMRSGHGPDALESEKFGILLGTSYQILDDCLDMAGSYTDKEAFKDAANGIVTLPVIAFAREGGAGSREMVDAVYAGDPAFRKERTEELSSLLVSDGFLTKCLDRAERLLDEAALVTGKLPVAAVEVLEYMRGKIHEAKL
ncbi:MAG: hypothetical protein GF408_06195 [Candidatus Omnitrophica bacterium]|nr:hypothetical protein [Candidatus Omnitrophota bacterium]